MEQEKKRKRKRQVRGDGEVHHDLMKFGQHVKKGPALFDLLEKLDRIAVTFHNSH